MIGLPFLYAIAGALFGGWAVLTLIDTQHPRRWGSAAFWGLLSLSFLAGDMLGDFGNGLLVLALVALAGTGQLARGNPPTSSEAQREASVARHGNRLFLPALIVPATALLGTLLLGPPLVEAKQVTLVSLGLGVIIALVVLQVWLKPPLRAPLDEGRSLSQIKMKAKVDKDLRGIAAQLTEELATMGATA